MELADLQREDFEAAKGTTFRLVHPEADPRELVLAEVESLSPDTAPPEGRRAPFSLIFREPDATTYFHQATVRLEHEDLGLLDLFLVPIGPDAGGMKYQAVFT